MPIYYWFKGVLMGFIVSAPMGPVGILCIKRVLNKGIFQGYASGLGASIGDAFYAALAAFGLSFLLCFILREEEWLRLGGGIFLVVIGIIWLKHKKSLKDLKSAPEKSDHVFQALTSSFFLDLANPMTLIVYLALFSGFGFTYSNPFEIKAWALVAGVAMGAALWWLLIIHLVALFKKYVNEKHIFIMDRITAWLVISFGAFILFTLIFPIKVFGRTF